ncbi:MAG: tetratricopeptide repeat protein, partial [Planctomycetota bacterium]|nr:tetratricopeptide repeat protein [Planctomycetota bacterium]
MNRPAFPALAALIALPMLAAPVASPSDAAALAGKAHAFIEFHAFLRGDRDGGIRFCLSAADEERGTPLAELAARTALAPNPASLSSVTVGETEVRRLLVSNPDMPPELRDVLRRFLARSLSASGHREEALALHRRRGLATAWLAAGPFQDFASACFLTIEPPEAGELLPQTIVADHPDAALFQRWRERPPWRLIPENRAFPFVHPWRDAPAGMDGAVLLFTSLVMESSDDKASFHVFSDVSWRLHVDDQLVADVNKEAAEEPAEHTVQFPLSTGKHALLLHLFPPRPDIEAASARVAFRLESSIPFAWDASAAGHVPFKSANARREARRPKYLTDLQAVANEAPALAASYALACSEQGMPDTSLWWLTRAIRDDKDGSSTFRTLAGIAAFNNRLLPPEWRRDAAAAWHREALKLRPDNVPSLLFLAESTTDAGQAYAFLDRAFAANPESLDIMLARAAWAEHFGGAALARTAREECVRLFPDSPAAQAALASEMDDGFMDMKRRLAARRAAAAAEPSSLDAFTALAEALADSGAGQEAGYVLRDAADQFAGDVIAMRRIGEIYSRLGMHAEAVEAMLEAVRLRPDDSALWRRLGDIFMAAGKLDDARNCWRTSLASDPGQFDLADMLDFLAGTPDPLLAESGIDAVAMTAQADAGYFSGDVVRLLDRQEIIFAADGSHRRLTHDIDLARNRKGSEALATVNNSGEMLSARVISPDGQILEPEPFPLAGGLRLPAPPPGSARELRSLETIMLDLRCVPPPAAWYFQDTSGRSTFLLSEFVVRVPIGFPFAASVANIDGHVEYSAERRDGFDIHRWTARPPPPILEPDAVDISERTPWVRIGVKTSWRDIVLQEIRRLEWRLAPSQQMLAHLTSLRRFGVENRPDPEGTAREIYRDVCENVEPGQGGEMAAHVYANLMGDRRILLLSLLRAARLNAQPAAARPDRRFLHSPAWELPDMESFTVPLVRLTLPDGVVRWLDVRFDSLPFGTTPDDLSGAVVMSCLPDGPLFETLPILPAEKSLVSRDVVLHLPDRMDGAVMASGRTLVRGVAGLALAQTLARAGNKDRGKIILGLVFPVFPDATLVHHEIARTDTAEANPAFRFELESRHPLE